MSNHSPSFDRSRSPRRSALGADERHRLAILFLIDPASDLRLLLEDVESAAHTDERRRLAGLLSHGLDSLADVLRRSVAGVRPGSDPGLTPQWLAEYLQRRIHVTAWLLDHWNSSPPTHDSVVDAAQAHETSCRSSASSPRSVRSPICGRSLGWANGPLADDRGGQPSSPTVDWPEEFQTTPPVREDWVLPDRSAVECHAPRRRGIRAAGHHPLRRAEARVVCAVLNQRATIACAPAASTAESHC